MAEIKQMSLDSQEVQMCPDLQGAQVSPDSQEVQVSPDRHLCMETDFQYQPTPPSSLHSFHQGHLHHNRKYLLREIWFLLGLPPRLLYIAPSPDRRIIES